MTDEQTKKAFEKFDSEQPTALLTNPKLLQNLMLELDKTVTGEYLTRHAILITAAGIWVANHATSSYNLMVNSESGAGKDHVTRHTLAIFPKDSVVTRTRISPTAFTYWHNSKYEPDWTWNGKICYLQDTNNSVLNCDCSKLW